MSIYHLLCSYHLSIAFTNCLVVGYADDHALLTIFLTRTIVSLQLLISMPIWQSCASMVITGTEAN